MSYNPLRKLMKARRAELGKMTQAQAAKRAGCNKSTWNRWEKEDYLPYEDNFPDIARALEIRIEDLRREMVVGWQGFLGQVSQTMELEGDNPEIPLSGYNLRNPELQRLEKMLESDLTSIEDKRLQLYLSEWRSLLRSQLINTDAHMRSLEASLTIYRRFVIILLGLPKSIFRTNSRKARVHRPPS